MMQHNDTTSHVKGQHLTLSERIEIQTLKRFDKSNRFIAKALGRSHSTINDEVTRGTATQKKLAKRHMRSIVKRVSQNTSCLKWKPSSITL